MPIGGLSITAHIATRTPNFSRQRATLLASLASRFASAAVRLTRIANARGVEELH
jgi:hypothetical protein